MIFKIDVVNSLVGVNDDFRRVDLTKLDKNIALVDFNSAKGVGTIEFNDTTEFKHFGKRFFDEVFSGFLFEWRAVGTAPEFTPEEIAANNLAQARTVEDSAARIFTKSDALIQYLITHTPAEAAAYVQTNVTNLATAKDVLAKIAMVISVLARANFRD